MNYDLMWLVESLKIEVEFRIITYVFFVCFFTFCKKLLFQVIFDNYRRIFFLQVTQ